MRDMIGVMDKVFCMAALGLLAVALSACGDDDTDSVGFSGSNSISNSTSGSLPSNQTSAGTSVNSNTTVSNATSNGTASNITTGGGTSNNTTGGTTGTTSTTGGTNNGTGGCPEGELQCDGVCVPINTIDHCGSCAPCPQLSNATATCDGESCVYACDEDWVDVNGDLGDEGSDGCDCLTTTPEVCDGEDNNCDGNVDTDDLSLDLSSCPQVLGAEGTGCVEGACVYSCQQGFTDLNGDLDMGVNGNGCECTGEGADAEVCDGLDNDCDGTVDNLQSQELLSVCEPPENAQTNSCINGACTFLCNSGFVDINRDLADEDSNGCECALSNSGIEVCDGVDNNCNGTADEENDQLSASCPDVLGARYDSCEAGGVCRYICNEDQVDINQDLNTEGSDGCECTITNGGIEICDGLDNDCNGETDDGAQEVLCSEQIGVCQGALATCVDGSADMMCTEEEYAAPAQAAEVAYEGRGRLEAVCDGEDGNCDGEADENCCDPTDDFGVGFVQTGTVGDTLEQAVPALAVNGDGSVLLAAWQQTTSSSFSSLPDDGDVYFVVADELGLGEAPVRRELSFPSAVGNIRPKVVWDGEGFSVVWIEDDSATDSVGWERFTAAGVRENGRSLVTATVFEDTEITDVDVTWTGRDDGTFVAVWSERPAGGGSVCSNPASGAQCVRARVYGPDGSTAGDVMELSPLDGGNPAALNPRIALADEGGGALVVWHGKPA
ncbi:MAG: MopE-related protein, partial [Myxococcota bacterium]